MVSHDVLHSGEYRGVVVSNATGVLLALKLKHFCLAAYVAREIREISNRIEEQKLRLFYIRSLEKCEKEGKSKIVSLAFPL